MLQMYPDLDEARAHERLIRVLIERHAGACDLRVLRQLLELCHRAAAAIDDRYCRDKLRRVEDFAAEMFSRADERTAFLKREILNALELFYSRLYSIETMRRAAARGEKIIEPLRT
jgi:hypothetical protein